MHIIHSIENTGDENPDIPEVIEQKPSAASGVNRKYRDRLFRLLFGNPEHKDWTLSLYNAINGTSYTNQSDIDFTTIEDALYMGMKNDVSFLLMDTMSFYEQQTSFNPNIPMRLLVYVGMVYSAYIQDPENKINIYSSRQQRFPAPKLVCFYNGPVDQPDQSVLWLSNAFDHACEADIDVRVTMLNINSGHNQALLDACQPLREYSTFVDAVRAARKLSRDMGAAVELALAAIPDDALIKPLLIANKAEVKHMFITEYDEAATMKLFREEFIEEGIEKGIKKGIEKGIRQGIDIGIKQGTDIADRKRMESDARGMYRKGLSPEDIAEIQQVDIKIIREILGLDAQNEQ